jgi:YD repeat-containing protein
LSGRPLKLTRYDSLYRIVGVTDAEGNSARFVLDINGNLIEQHHPGIILFYTLHRI